MARIAHLISGLESTSIPRRHVIIDTEARAARRHGAIEQRWHLGCAEYLSLPTAAGDPLLKQRDYDDPAALWSDVAGFTRPNGRTVVWAHNLSYDLRISRALVELPRLGFRLQGIVLERTASWASFRSDRRTILCCDLASWLPASLAAIAGDLGLRQVDVNHETATPAELFARCRQDVAITRAAVVALLELIEREDLGPFRPTGSGQSNAAWRRRFLTHPVLAHDDGEALDAERRAMWTGRCEAWRHGSFAEPGLAEYDLRLAYCHIAASELVPTRLAGRTGPLKGKALATALASYSVLAECTVTTDQPVAPAADGDRIHWPIGRFDTLLWEPEINIALEAGARVEVRRAWLYRRAPALAAFAGWVLDHLDPADREGKAVERRLLKHWSRTLVGRMALRYRRWERFGQAPEMDLRVGLLCDLDTGGVTDSVQIGLDVMELAELAETDSSTPAVTGWVMSEARARLWRLMNAAGLDDLIYVDTDSLIVNRRGARRLDDLIEAGGAYSLVRKQSIRELHVIAPRNLIVEAERRVAGVPKRAIRLGDAEYSGEVWRSIKGSMMRGELDQVTIVPRRFTMSTPDRRRDHLPDGRTVPHTVEHDAQLPAVR